jgi:hypothetical protein
VDILATYYIRGLLLSGKFTQARQLALESKRHRDPPSFLARYTTAMVVALALCESIGIFGLVLFLLGDTYRTLHAFISLSAVSMVYYRPKLEELETLCVTMKNG